ncbi:MAG TPA: RHS repeat-associated core domain-containing protein [Arsenophonus nasoniae]
MRHQKLKNVRFAFSNGRDDSQGYQVIWKEGKIEYLTLVGQGFFVVSQIVSPLGHAVKLTWDFNGQVPLLRTIQDTYGELCSIDYRDNGATVTVWPQTTARYQLDFVLTNSRWLDNVTRRTQSGPALSWQMQYSQAGQRQEYRLLSAVDYPTGMRDEVTYHGTEGLRFPTASGRTDYLPVVLRHRHLPGGGQAVSETEYRYSTQNFLGFNGNFGDWAADSDYLYNTLTNYTYDSIATTRNEEQVVTVKRTYNNYHLQIEEEVWRDGLIQRSETEYYAQPGVFIEGQPAQFLLPRKTTQYYIDNSGATRQAVTLTEFDEYGNPTRQEEPDGTVTETVYYPAGGEGSACPAEPNGFVRFIKQKVITPRPSDYPDTPAMKTHYTYKVLGDNHGVVQASEAQYGDQQLLVMRETNYQTSGRELGRISAIVETRYQNGSPYRCHQQFSSQVSGDQLVQTLFSTGHDGLTSSMTRVQQVDNGQLLQETDVQGVTTTYHYDDLGRILLKTHAAGTGYESHHRWSYSLEASGPVTIVTDAKGVQVKSCFDGRGRQIGQYRYESGQWHEVTGQRYNALGEQQQVTGQDWLLSGLGQLAQDSGLKIACEMEYDGWGLPRTLRFSDGYQQHQENNPVQLSQTTYSSGGGLSSGKHWAQHERQSQLLQQEVWYDSRGNAQGSKHYRWDGLGRLRHETDERGQVTQRSYDAYGRVVTQTLADGTILSRTYAPHLPGEHITSISVSGLDGQGQRRSWQLGEQQFDSLGRITRRQSGGRVTQYQYDGASPLPSQIIRPSGEVVNYDYLPALGNAVRKITTTDIEQTFRYDNQTGDMLSAQVNGQRISYQRRADGEVIAETFQQAGQARTANYQRSLLSLLTGVTDISGQQTRYQYDEHGRLIKIADSTLQTELAYDGLNRLVQQTTRSAGGDNQITTRLSYDDLGREISRQIETTAGEVLTISQSWLANGLLASRQMSQNQQLLQQAQYRYDNRNRLIDYQLSGSELPQDGYGQRMKGQTYQYDALNNLQKVTTTLADGSDNESHYFYTNSQDPTQLTGLTHSHPAYPPQIALEYDSEGRLTKDEAGRRLRYNALGQLVQIGGQQGNSHYDYDALNRLISQQLDDEPTRVLYYQGQELVNEVTDGQARRFIKAGHQCLGVSDDSGLTLTATDSHASVLWSQGGHHPAGKRHNWSAYGSGESSDGLLGFNGERPDPYSGVYHLGNGYRAYSPVLMRFTCPDDLSPFGAGGINAYAYCAGDPINHTDPSGHLSWQSMVGILGAIIGIGFTVITGGMAIAAAGGVMAAISAASTTTLLVGAAGVVSDITAIASGAMEASHPEMSSTLGWVSFATGLVGAIIGVGLFVKSATKSLRQRLWKIKTEGLSGRGPRFLDKFRRSSRITPMYSTELSHLPNELLINIAEYLPYKDLSALSKLNTRFNSIAKYVGNSRMIAQEKAILKYPLTAENLTHLRGISGDARLKLEYRFRFDNYIAKYGHRNIPNTLLKKYNIYIDKPSRLKRFFMIDPDSAMAAAIGH